MDKLEREAKILQDSGIKDGDPRMVEFLRRGRFTDDEDYIRKLDSQTFIWHQADVKKPSPSFSTIAQTIPSVGRLTNAYDGITSDELGERALALGRHFTKNQPEIQRINKELERRSNPSEVGSSGYTFK